MAWNDDSFGAVFKSHEVKLFFNGDHTWAMKLSQLYKQDGTVRIITYSLPDLEYIKEQIGRRPNNIFIICHSKFEDRAREIKVAFDNVRIAINDAVHSKVCLIEPDTVYIGSANFGNSRWHESIVGIRSRDAHDAYVSMSFNKLWSISDEIGDPITIKDLSLFRILLGKIYEISIPTWALISQVSYFEYVDGMGLLIGFPTENLLSRFMGSEREKLLGRLVSEIMCKNTEIITVG